MTKKRSMPPEIVDYFKKKGGKDVEKSDDNRRKDAVTKARERLEARGKDKKEDKKDK
jgi:hypothetical protein